ncbi:hypothetical protein K4H28_08935 [Deefgea tanakiae]|uniref:Esterase n=1 Tax=Deefgea tanakiae TaxID=2865840 RepID=A0ABX8Z1N3_9NEIS|nr:alpha/beta hydrolase-fold protein [Deefgea tanakiae]QZA76473.1 hypothetical protein K4H28_08935 [Deefgea tanakiae]
MFGHAGAKVLAFPTRDGRFYEYENIGFIQSIAHKIEAGYLQIFCVDNLALESFYCFSRPPAERIVRHIQYEEYILNEVLPFMHSINSQPHTHVYGASLGAYHAVNIALRHPHLFQKLTAFSGRYDLTLSVESFQNLLSGYYDENVYFHTPCHFLPNLHCDQQLQHLRAMDITLTIGHHDPFLANNQSLSATLWQKGIKNSLHIWQGRAHHANAWRKMGTLYL